MKSGPLLFLVFLGIVFAQQNSYGDEPVTGGAITCANVRCMGKCVDTPTGPKCVKPDNGSGSGAQTGSGKPRPSSSKPSSPSQTAYVDEPNGSGATSLQAPVPPSLPGGPGMGPGGTPPPPPGPPCPQYEQWNQCAHCEFTCQNPGPLCPPVCMKPACQCISGFARNDNGQCIRLADCFTTTTTTSTAKPSTRYLTPTVATTTTPQLVCGPNEQVDGCGDICDARCGDPPIKACPAICAPPACVCKPGFSRNAQNQCIPTSSCPKTTTTSVRPLYCRANEEVNPCGNLCEPKCSDRTPICIEICAPPECVCKSGFFRDTNVGRCVPSNQCPVVEPTQRVQLPYVTTRTVTTRTTTRSTTTRPPTCPNNEVLNQCGNRCEPSCSNRNPICILICGPPACTCRTGYLRHPITRQCVQAYSCPPTSTTTSAPTTRPLICSATEEVNQCGNLCEPTCFNRQPVCIAICNPPACVCKQGLFRDPMNRCVQSYECPVNSPGTTQPTTEPPNDCSTLHCPEGQHCLLQQVWCIRAPCPAMPYCKSVTTLPPFATPEPCWTTQCGPGYACQPSNESPVCVESSTTGCVLPCPLGYTCAPGPNGARCIPPTTTPSYVTTTTRRQYAPTGQQQVVGSSKNTNNPKKTPSVPSNNGYKRY